MEEKISTRDFEDYCGDGAVEEDQSGRLQHVVDKTYRRKWRQRCWRSNKVEVSKRRAYQGRSELWKWRVVPRFKKNVNTEKGVKTLGENLLKRMQESHTEKGGK